MSEETSTPVEISAPEPSPETTPKETPEGGSNSTENKEPPKPSEPKRKLKVKVHGKEEERDEDEIVRDYQKYAHAQTLAQEAAMSKKQVAEFVKALQEDPEKVLSNPKLGIKRRELAEKWLREELERELADPKDLELAELKRYKEEREAQEKEAAEAKEQEEFDAKVAEQRKEIEDKLVAAMESTKLAKDEATLRSMAYYLRTCEARGIEVTPEEIAQHVEERLLGNYMTLAKSRKAADLVKLLGDDVVNEIRKYDLEQLRAQRQPKDAPPPPVAKPREPKEPQVYDRFAAAEMARKKLGL